MTSCIGYLFFVVWTASICYGQDILRLRNAISKGVSTEAREAYGVLKDINVAESFLSMFSSLPLNTTALSLSQECVEDMLPIILFAQNGSSVPEDFVSGSLMQMFDAIGKIPPGIFKGAMTFWGYYPECKNISYQFGGRNRLWETEYSRAKFNMAFKDAKNPNNCNSTMNSLASWDFCMPKGCNSQDVLMLLQSIELPSTNSSPFCAVELINEVPEDPDYRTWIVWIIIGTIIGIGIIASILDYFILDFDSIIRREKSTQIMLSFSLYANISEIFSAGKSRPGQIGTIHCIRFFSICWVVFGHSFLTAMGSINNPVDMLDMYKDLTTQLIVNALFSVDSFFFISGLLLSFLWFKEYKRSPTRMVNGKAWAMFYVHRIIRLSPPYYLIIAFFTFIYPTLLHNMPLYLSPDASSLSSDSCKKYYWVNFLYLNNYLHWKHECYGVSWYLAADTQMFVFTPLLIIPLALNKFVGLVVAGGALLFSTAANIFTVYKYHYPATFILLGWVDPEMKRMDEYKPLMYAAPWIRCQVYIIGILVGYFMQMKPRMKINKIVNLSIWAFSFALMLFVVLCLYKYMNGHELSLFVRAIYSAFSRPLWAVGLSWIVISCYYGYGGPINQFMSWNIWVPLSRLSYCVYLVHYVVMFIIMGLSQGPLIYSNFSHMYCTLFLPVLLISFFVALIWSAAFEIPFTKIETVLLRPKRSDTSRIENGENKQPFEAWEIKNGEDRHTQRV